MATPALANPGSCKNNSEKANSANPKNPLSREVEAYGTSVRAAITTEEVPHIASAGSYAFPSLAPKSNNTGNCPIPSMISARICWRCCPSCVKMRRWSGCCWIGCHWSGSCCVLVQASVGEKQRASARRGAGQKSVLRSRHGKRTDEALQQVVSIIKTPK